MTKARDRAGFASSSVTTTASDGLVLKGDGSSTDVVIKNGANATVATVADGTTTLAATANLTAGGSITATGASVGALARGSIQVGNSSGVAAALAKGTSGYVLTAGANDLSWAEAGASTTTGAVGTYGLLLNTESTNYEAGSERAASNFAWANASGNITSTSGVTLAGTWRCMGYNSGADNAYSVTLWLRIS